MEEIKSEQIFRCPICNHAYASADEARACAAAGVWNKIFDDGASRLWKWNIFCPIKGSAQVMAIIPKKYDTRYDWTPATKRCPWRGVSLFNSFSDTFYNIYYYTKAYIMGFKHAFARYHLVPPLRWMRDVPDALVDELQEVMKLAGEERQCELLAPDRLNIAQYLGALVAYGFRDLTAPIHTKSGKEIPAYIDLSSLPASKLVSGEPLFNLEKVYPELSEKLAWSGMQP